MYAHTLKIRLANFLRNRDGSLNSRRKYVLDVYCIKIEDAKKGLYISDDSDFDNGVVECLLITNEKYFIGKRDMRIASNNFSSATNFVEFLHEFYNYIYKDEELLKFVNDRISLRNKEKTECQLMEELEELKGELIDFKNNYQPKEGKEV